MPQGSSNPYFFLKVLLYFILFYFKSKNSVLLISVLNYPQIREHWSGTKCEFFYSWRSLKIAENKLTLQGKWKKKKIENSKNTKKVIHNCTLTTIWSSYILVNSTHILPGCTSQKPQSNPWHYLSHL